MCYFSQQHIINQPGLAEENSQQEENSALNFFKFL
jgi:hypothetical protein